MQNGYKVWMAENLNYNASGSACYKDNPKNCEKYGRLYDYQTALDACPCGWKLPPSKEDFYELISNLGESKKQGLLLLKGGETGFDALCAGVERRGYEWLGEVGMILSCDRDEDPKYVWTLGIYDYELSLDQYASVKEKASIRCLKK